MLCSDMCTCLNLLWVAHSGVSGEGEIISYVLVVGQPAVSAYHSISIHCHLKQDKYHSKHIQMQLSGLQQTYGCPEALNMICEGPTS